MSIQISLVWQGVNFCQNDDAQGVHNACTIRMYNSAIRKINLFGVNWAIDFQESILFLKDIDRKPTKAERVAEHELEESLHRLRMHRLATDFKRDELFFDDFPKGWHSVEDKYPDRPKRTRITARFDEDVVKFFKRSGAGYQAKMNEVLRMYMFARVSKYVEARGERDRLGDLF